MIKVGTKTIGVGLPCFIAAEIGINHNGDMDLAARMIDAAADAGVDAVKFQNYNTEDFILNPDLTYSYISQGQTVVERQSDMFKRYELSAEQLAFLKSHCDKRNVVFFSTPTGKDGVDKLLKLGCPLLKNGSDFLVNLPLIGMMAQTGVPVIISTGMATLGEIDDAVRAFEGNGGKELIILHCTSSYPTPNADVHLKKIPALAAAFNYPVGFSDHTWGIESAIGARVLGAAFIEKHFTLDRNLPGPDHRFSSDPAEMKMLVEAVRKIEACLGEGKIGPTGVEEKGREEYRLSCVAKRDIAPGEVIRDIDIGFSRPATGIPPKDARYIIGKKAKMAIKKGGMINLEFLES